MILGNALDNPKVIEVLRAVGTPYVWGAGKPADGVRAEWWRGTTSPLAPLERKDARGFDCSGFVQAALVRLGRLSPEAEDRTAGQLYDVSPHIINGGEQFGDLAFYGTGRTTHVALVLGPGLAISASGGTANTFGDKLSAFVQIHRIAYRSDFRAIGRP